jgi:hypothetical protein
LFLIGVLFLACAGSPAPAPAVESKPADELDAAIRETSDYLNKQLPAGNKLVVLNIQSEYPALSEYIIDELIANTVNDRVFTVVDRQQLDTLREELDFQMTGEVDDDTAQALGRIAGAQIIVSGAVSKIGDLYRLRVRGLSVQTAQIAGQFNRNIPDGPTVAALVRSQATGYGESSGRPAAKSSAQAAPAVVAPAAAPVAPAPAVVAPVAVPAPVAPPTLIYKIGDTGPAGGLVFYPAAQKENAKPVPVTQNYKIGDTGPAGGTIFYVNPMAGEWKYLEAAPARTEVKTFWASEEFPVDGILDVRAVGTGKSNTEYIMKQAVSRGGGFDWAAEACDSLTVNGYDDWFLPSQDELHMMYGNLSRKGLGDFKAEEYWSSTTYNYNTLGNLRKSAKVENFSDGAQSGADYNNLFNRYDRNIKYRVRAIRAF